MPSSVTVSTGLQHHQPLPPPTQKPGYPLFPLYLRLPFQANGNLTQSTAEGKAIPIDFSTAENRTTALRQIHRNFPSRHRYAKSSSAQNTTFSEPVIVRSYYNPQLPSRSNSVSRGGRIVRKQGSAYISNGSTKRKSKSRRFAIGRLSLPRIMTGFGAFDGPASASSAENQDDGAKLPPLEAFTFKSFLDNVHEPASANDISADLDRIAEICARSRYSLSNRYEVHHAPHGSGSEFLASAKQPLENPGPTLQAVTSDDEQPNTTARKRRRVARSSSRAMGTLETIMSSSRSSEEDRSKKKSARELSEQVRGRVATKHSTHTSPTASSPRTATEARESSDQLPPSLALIDNSPQPRTHHRRNSSSAVALLSEPSLPQPSTTLLHTHTSLHLSSRETNASPSNHLSRPPATATTSSVDDTTAAGLLSSLADWIPWKSTDASQSSRKAEGRLRELLRASDGTKPAVD